VCENPRDGTAGPGKIPAGPSKGRPSARGNIRQTNPTHPPGAPGPQFWKQPPKAGEEEFISHQRRPRTKKKPTQPHRPPKLQAFLPGVFPPNRAGPGRVSHSHQAGFCHGPQPRPPGVQLTNLPHGPMLRVIVQYLTKAVPPIYSLAGQGSLSCREFLGHSSRPRPLKTGIEIQCTWKKTTIGTPAPSQKSPGPSPFGPQKRGWPSWPAPGLIKPGRPQNSPQNNQESPHKSFSRPPMELFVSFFPRAPTFPLISPPPTRESNPFQLSIHDNGNRAGPSLETPKIATPGPP